ncbi:hypothetical protein FQA47_025094 [Oryzias melastigma]|uniref:Uncharacterized protein n=1 Tax=Oryzias melastigma TaxID=30732 RepID=A0A834BS00_ORYME|nr:hypothetical protein FQA47_025094 [Oryzias melastigma]
MNGRVGGTLQGPGAAASPANRGPPNNPIVPRYLRLNRIPPLGRHNGGTVRRRLCSGSGIPPLIRNLSFTDLHADLQLLILRFRRTFLWGGRGGGRSAAS